MKVPNNNQIDNTSYYILPCGRQLEDFIVWMRLDFAWGSALKYIWRAGMKDGESASKDRMKAYHSLRLISRTRHESMDNLERELERLYTGAREWDGKEAA